MSSQIPLGSSRAQQPNSDPLELARETIRIAQDLGLRIREYESAQNIAGGIQAADALERRLLAVRAAWEELRPLVLRAAQTLTGDDRIDACLRDAASVSRSFDLAVKRQGLQETLFRTDGDGFWRVGVAGSMLLPGQCKPEVDQFAFLDEPQKTTALDESQAAGRTGDQPGRPSSSVQSDVLGKGKDADGSPEGDGLELALRTPDTKPDTEKKLSLPDSEEIRQLIRRMKTRSKDETIKSLALEIVGGDSDRADNLRRAASRYLSYQEAKAIGGKP